MLFSQGEKSIKKGFSDFLPISLKTFDRDYLICKYS